MDSIVYKAKTILFLGGEGIAEALISKTYIILIHKSSPPFLFRPQMVYPAGNGGRLGDTCALDASANDVHTMVRVKKHSI